MIEDLIGRQATDFNTERLSKHLQGKTVLITGAAGSIGSGLVRQLAELNVERLILCDNAETPLHELSLTIEEEYPGVPYSARICNVEDYIRMQLVVEECRPDYIFHSAAYKHVPLMENHPCEAVITNVLGTKNMLDLAINYRAEAFIMISTDKAVNPTSIMGATKRVAEIYTQATYNRLKAIDDCSTRIITTRFGNVLGSNGSVLPHFKKQIAQGGPLTVTHPDMSRYFMTMTEACGLVLEAACIGQGGEIFLFDMGEPIRISELAKSLILMEGLEPEEDIKIVYTGIRPGEKLHEELHYGYENIESTPDERISLIKDPRDYNPAQVNKQTEELIGIARTYNKAALVKALKLFVPEFHSRNTGNKFN